ncbi:MAG TPA: DinB family protein [Gemmatimonadales bacterium]|nr:DinB family protein [Gemmatimonadales bacterium]
MSKPEPWLAGAVPGVTPLLQPAAHALLLSREQIAALRDRGSELTPEVLWTRPGGAASIGFHLRHLAGATNRLLTYARGGQLNAEQMAFLKQEGVREGGVEDLDSLLAGALAAIDDALEEVRATPESRLLEAREVGRAKLPTNVLGLLFHVAEHSQRHVGQVATTVKVVANG